MDSNSPSLHRHQFPWLGAERSMTPRDRRAHEQFAREFADQVLRTRAAMTECSK